MEPVTANSPHRENKDFRFGSIQVEITSRCNLRCRTCLYAYFEPQWVPRDMSRRVLDRIFAIADRCRSIHLQGWGESLLRPDLAEIARTITKAGGRVTLSTNGTIADRDQAGDLVAAGIESVAFSIAGPDQQAHDRLKGEGTFAKAVQSIGTFNVARKNAAPPVLLLNYLLTPANIRRLNAAMTLCKKLGADTVAGTHMVPVAVPAQVGMIAYNRKAASPLTLFLARASVLWKGVDLVLPPLQDSLVPICAKNPVENLFIGSDGAVAPCVYLAPPLEGRFPRLFKGREIAAERLVMGNLHESRLESIWARPRYRAFRDRFKRRIDLYQALMPDARPSFEGLEQLEKSVEMLKRRYREDALRLPGPCRTCAAAKGL